MTLLCADLRWPELFQIIAETNGKNMSDEEVEALSYDERCRLLNLNPITGQYSELERFYSLHCTGQQLESFYS